ncbi:phage tail protein [Bartonella acomydis]|uniref:Phage tail collar domain-containing protein n=1 Tax=Bartonella acomydis TaxID=686234 RepID=A0ABP9MP59_9HYPH
MSTIYNWSLTASNNAGADSFINWSEGQAPHTVNDSARGMMQRVREYLSDTGGGLEGVVSVDNAQQTTSIRLQSKTQFLEYKNDIVVRFKANGKNVGATKFFLNGFASKPIYKASEVGNPVLLEGGEIQQGCIYALVYDEGLSGWQLLNPTLKRSSRLRHLPTGFIGAFAMENLPAGWLLCDGGTYLRATYRDLFATIGTMWGGGDNETTFNVPDLRGMFLRGYDYFGFVDADRVFPSVQQCSLRAHEHSIGFFPPSESRSRGRRALSSGTSRGKRSVYVDYEILPHTSHVDEECVGLTGDAFKRCNEAFDNIEQTPGEESSVESKIYTSHPFFLKHSRFNVFKIPRPSGEDLGEHDHTILMNSFGGVETRPINMSVVYGIKS